MGDVLHAFTIEELADRVGVPVRTVRFYIAEGILSGPAARGRAATYGEEHLLRLRLARELAERRLPLVDIRERMALLSTEDLRAVLAAEERDTAALSRKAQEQSPREYLSALLQRSKAARQSHLKEALSPLDNPANMPFPSVYAPAMKRRPRDEKGQSSDAPSSPPDAWERWSLAPGVELHVQAHARVSQRGLIEHVLRVAGRSTDVDD